MPFNLSAMILGYLYIGCIKSVKRFGLGSVSFVNWHKNDTDYKLHLHITFLSERDHNSNLQCAIKVRAS
jgi:hypothetical protein